MIIKINCEMADLEQSCDRITENGTHIGLHFFVFQLNSFCKSDQMFTFHSVRMPSAIDCMVISF